MRRVLVALALVLVLAIMAESSSGATMAAELEKVVGEAFAAGGPPSAIGSQDEHAPANPSAAEEQMPSPIIIDDDVNKGVNVQSTNIDDVPKPGLRPEPTDLPPPMNPQFVMEKPLKTRGWASSAKPRFDVKIPMMKITGRSSNGGKRVSSFRDSHATQNAHRYHLLRTA